MEGKDRGRGTPVNEGGGNVWNKFFQTKSCLLELDNI